MGILSKVSAPTKDSHQEATRRSSHHSVGNQTNTVKMAASLTDVIRFLRSTNSAIIDFRPRSLYVQGHIVGAVNATNRSELLRMLAGLEKGSQILVYGQRAEARIYDTVRAMHIPPSVAVRVYEGGWSEWTNLGLHSFDITFQRTGL